MIGARFFIYLRALIMVKKTCKRKATYTTNDHGHREYRVNGLLHRLDGPALIHSDNSYCWYSNGMLHRLGGPAVKTASSSLWYVLDLLHRLDGPAWKDDKKTCHFVNGKLHRVTGPALIYHDVVSNYHRELYYVNGVSVSKARFDYLQSQGQLIDVYGDPTLIAGSNSFPD